MRDRDTAATIGRPPTAPLERERELSEIRRVLDEAAAGRGELLLVEGPAGIGKTMLLEEAARTAGAAGMEVLRARAGELERGYPFGVASSLLEMRVARAPSSERRGLLRGRARLAASVAAPDAEGARAASPTDEFALIHGLYWVIVNLSEQRPVALLVDDVQWADPPSLRFLLYLAQRLADLPVALLVALRSGDPESDADLVARLSTVSAAPPLRPAELSEGAARELFAAAEIDSDDPDDCARASWTATSGNPFLLTELMAALREASAGGVRIGAGDVEALTPRTVGRTTLVRLSRLGPDSLALARACSVLADGQPMALVTSLAGLDPEDAAAAAERLTAAEIIGRDDLVSFAHPMIRSAVYAELPAGERSKLHLEAARLLHRLGSRTAEIANHLMAGTPCGEPWALDVLHDAAREATRKGSPQAAVHHLRQALESSPAPETAGAMLIDLGLAEAAAGETTSLERFDRALSLIDDRPERARAIYALGQTLYRYGRHAEAIETFRRGADLLARDRDLAMRFEAAAMCSSVAVSAGHAEAMRRLASMVREIDPAGPMNAPERELLAVHSVELALTKPPAAQSAGLAHAALADGELLREETSESMAVNLAILALLFTARFSEAERAVNAVLADARARGALLAYAEGSLIRAVVMLNCGRIDEAIADAQAAIGGMEWGWHAMVPHPQSVLVRCYVDKGDLGAAERVLQDVERLLPDAESKGLETTYLCARGITHLAAGRPDPALRDLLAAGQALKVYGTLNPIAVPWRTPAAFAAHSVGDRETADRLIEEELEIARAFELAPPLGAALRVRAVMRGQGTEGLEEAIEVLEDAEAPLELARALLDLGAAMRREGRRRDCREPLRRALELTHRCGATGLERRARDELLASGARPRRPVRSGLEALTPSERRIADLVAAGSSNREVAEALFLSKGTVEWHLTHVYRKLDIGSREELAELLAGESA